MHHPGASVATSDSSFKTNDDGDADVGPRDSATVHLSFDFNTGMVAEGNSNKGKWLMDIFLVLADQEKTAQQYLALVSKSNLSQEHQQNGQQLVNCVEMIELALDLVCNAKTDPRNDVIDADCTV